MRIKSIDETFLDYPDNISLAVIVFMPGCEFNCINCQNPELRNPESGNEFSTKEAIALIKGQAQRSKTNKIILSGGDPLSCYNIDNTIEILDNMSSEYDFCIYTGFDINYIKSNDIKGFKFIKCGNYIEDKKITSYKDDSGIQFASTNQKLYDENYNLLSENGYYKF